MEFLCFVLLWCLLSDELDEELLDELEEEDDEDEDVESERFLDLYISGMWTPAGSCSDCPLRHLLPCVRITSI